MAAPETGADLRRASHTEGSGAGNSGSGTGTGGDFFPQTDLARLVQELQKERVIIPSRHLKRLVREEAWRRSEAFALVGSSSCNQRNAGGSAPTRTAENVSQAQTQASAEGYFAGGGGSSNPIQEVRPTLLTNLVEEVLDYCRALLLAQEEIQLPRNTASNRRSPPAEGDKELHNPGDAIIDGSNDTAKDLVSLMAGGNNRATDSTRTAAAVFDREAHLASLLARCAETYGQLILTNSEVSFCQVQVKHMDNPRNELTVSVRTDATIWEVKEAIARFLGRPGILTSARVVTRGNHGTLKYYRDNERLGKNRSLLMVGVDFSPEKGSPAHFRDMREAAIELHDAKLSNHPTRLRNAIEHAVQTGLENSRSTAPWLQFDSRDLDRARELLERLEGPTDNEDGGGAALDDPMFNASSAPSGRQVRRGTVFNYPSAAKKITPPSSPSRKSPTIIPTPFFEAVYAVVTRAAQQGLRQAAGPNQDSDMTSQLAARVEEELGRLFRSHEFGRSGRGMRRGGTKVAMAGRVEEESAKSAARAEEDLGKLIRAAYKLKTDLHQVLSPFLLDHLRNARADTTPEQREQLRAQFGKQLGLSDPFVVQFARFIGNQEFQQLLERFRHAHEESKGHQDADKTGGNVDGEAKDGQGDLAACSASVDALIAGFKARASTRTRRPADQSGAMQHISKTRSPIMTSVLPSPREQLHNVTQQSPRGRSSERKQFRELGNSTALTPHGAAARFLMSSPNASAMSPGRPKSAANKIAMAKVLTNTWALSQERVPHVPNRQGTLQTPRILAASF